MSVLNNPPQPAPSHAEIAADNIRRQARHTFNTMVQAFNAGSKLFWQNSNATPEEVAAALGTDAQEIFELHAKLGQLIATVKPTAIVAGVSVVGQFEYNEDGTVTVLPPNNLP